MNKQTIFLVGPKHCLKKSILGANLFFWRSELTLENSRLLLKMGDVERAKNGRAAKYRQKVCSSKRPSKLEPRSVRPNDVFENLACRINRELVKAEVFEKRVFEQTTPLK